MKKKIAIVICFLLALLISGCSGESAKVKKFEVEGLTITLTDAFEVKEQSFYTSLFADDIKIVIQPISIENTDGLSLDEWAKQTCDGISCAEGVKILSMPTAENNYIAEYSLEATSETFDTINMLAFFKSDDFYWNITFACHSEEYFSLRQQFLAWVETVELP